MVKVKIEGLKGTKHRKFNTTFDSSYGFVPDTMSPDGEELDAYVLSMDNVVENFEGKCIAIIHRTDDDDDKLIVIPDNLDDISDDEIRKQTNFREKYLNL